MNLCVAVHKCGPKHAEVLTSTWCRVFAAAAALAQDMVDMQRGRLSNTTNTTGIDPSSKFAGTGAGPGSKAGSADGSSGGDTEEAEGSTGHGDGSSGGSSDEPPQEEQE